MCIPEEQLGTGILLNRIGGDFRARMLSFKIHSMALAKVTTIADPDPRSDSLTPEAS
jgi:hypothetical protein